MRNIIAIAIAGLLLGQAGCASVNVRESQPPPASTGAPAPADARPAPVIRRENADLRAQLTKLEDDNRQWNGGNGTIGAIDAKKNEIRALKDQKGQLEHDRDRYKKMLKD
jgi:hypothetical protein